MDIPISIVIPCFNEEIYIGQRIRDIKYDIQNKTIILALENNGELGFLKIDFDHFSELCQKCIRLNKGWGCKHHPILLLMIHPHFMFLQLNLY